MDYTAMDFWWKVTLTLINLAIGVYLFWERHNDSTSKRINDYEEVTDTRLDNHSSRLAKLEAISETAPDHADIAKVYDSLNTLAATVNQLVGENRGQSDTLKLILNQITMKGMK